MLVLKFRPYEGENSFKFEDSGVIEMTGAMDSQVITGGFTNVAYIVHTLAGEEQVMEKIDHDQQDSRRMSACTRQGPGTRR